LNAENVAFIVSDAILYDKKGGYQRYPPQAQFYHHKILLNNIMIFISHEPVHGSDPLRCG
jgi:hypothetical protein